MKQIAFEQFAKVLTQKSAMEEFLSALLGNSIRLSSSPVPALFDQNIHLAADIRAKINDDSAYHIYFDSCGVRSLIQELQGYAREYSGSSMDNLHIIMIMQNKAFNGEQS